MPIDEINKVCFIGSGTIGCWNSLIAAIGGYEAVVYDLSEEMLASAPQRHSEQLQRAVEFGLFSAEHAEAGLKNIRYTSNLEDAVANADLVSESVPENIQLKRQVHQQLDELCPEKTIITTNSSSLLVSEIEDAVNRRDKFAALHFHLFGRLIDIVAGKKTTPAIIDILKRYAQSINQVPIIHTTEKDGFLYNSLLILNMKNAIILVADGYGSYENIDRSLLANSPASVPTFAIIDAVGIDLCRDIMQAKYERSNDVSFKQAVDFLTPYVDKGDLGEKTGKGFYSHPNPAWQQPEFLIT